MRLLVFTLFVALCAVCVAGPAIADTIVIRDGGLFGDAAINTYYNGNGHSSSIVTTLTGANVSASDLVIVWEPDTSLSAGELTALGAHVAGGGRVAFFGENGAFAALNGRINSAVGSLGGTMIIDSVTYDGGFHTATTGNGQILAHALTAGMTDFRYAAPSGMSSVSGGEGFFLDTSLAHVWGAEQLVSGGSLVVVADSNITTLDGSFDNDIFFDNLLGPVAQVPEPGTLALIGLGLVGVAFGRRRRAKQS